MDGGKPLDISKQQGGNWRFLGNICHILICNKCIFARHDLLQVCRCSVAWQNKTRRDESLTIRFELWALGCICQLYPQCVSAKPAVYVIETSILPSAW